jgi:hypothetical protein
VLDPGWQLSDGVSRWTELIPAPGSRILPDGREHQADIVRGLGEAVVLAVGTDRVDDGWCSGGCSTPEHRAENAPAQDSSCARPAPGRPCFRGHEIILLSSMHYAPSPKLELFSKRT